MKKEFHEHLSSILLVSIILIGIIFYFRTSTQEKRGNIDKRVQQIIALDFYSPDNSFHQALLADLLQLYYPERGVDNDSLLLALKEYRHLEKVKSLENAHLKKSLSWTIVPDLMIMYFKFILIFGVVMFLTYYGVETIGILRFVRKQQARVSYLELIIRNLRQHPMLKNWNQRLRFTWFLFSLFVKALLKGLAYLVLFSPAYVIAYSIRSDFNTDSVIFMILLGIVSNGLLINYANKFYTFLRTENRKGYVFTAKVKNLSQSYAHTGQGDLPYRTIFSIKKRFKDHVFAHIFINARYQYISAMKEQASFLITGLIIIEMALNVHGHLTYEMLQHLLYRNYDIVIIIVLGIFWLVKATEITADYLAYLNAKKISNE